MFITCLCTLTMAIAHGHYPFRMLHTRKMRSRSSVTQLFSGRLGAVQAYRLQSPNSHHRLPFPFSSFFSGAATHFAIMGQEGTVGLAQGPG